MTAQQQPTTQIVQVALPVPLYRVFDYDCSTLPAVGTRLLVPFGQRQLVGICVGHGASADSQVQRKAVLACLDLELVWPPSMWRLLQWSADYYQQPLGEVLQHALPVLARQGEALSYQATEQLRCTALGQAVDLASLQRAPQQQRLLAALQRQPLLQRDVRLLEVPTAAQRALLEKGWIERHSYVPSQQQDWAFGLDAEPLKLNPEQALAVATIAAASKPQPYLLEGITGSGKTEVYLQVMTEVLRKGQQVLVLVPEIGLTPQTLRRFQQRFTVPVVMLHSALTDRERLDAWLDAKLGHAAIIIGTRSAVWTPCARLGLIIIDEEHDLSFKAQDGFRYHARDVAVMRAHEEQVPIILGSATPALETLNNAQQRRYAHLRLTKRAGAAKIAKQWLLDIKGLKLQAGVAMPLLQLMQQHLQAGQQVLLFLNRRGYAPALLCHDCGWLAQCSRCDAYYTVHQQLQQLHCHHCGAQQRLAKQCGGCGSSQLSSRGVGTEQLEQMLAQRFPEYPVLRIDRDTTRRKGSLQQHLEAARANQYPILVGTQMLAKGHHFPEVTLVALLDVDGALYSGDFRAAERLGQLYTQVAGRAGRASKAGTVVLQTHHPEHALVQDLINNGYHHFAQTALRERQLTQLPPYSYLALLRAEALQQQAVQEALAAVAALLPRDAGLQLLGPMPALLERRAGKYRYQLLLQCRDRGLRHQILRYLVPQLAQLPALRKVRWSLDIDPYDFT